MKPTTKNRAASIRLAGKSYRRRMRIVLGLLVCLAGCSNKGRQDPMDGPVSAGGAICLEPTWLVGAIDPEKQPHFAHVFTVQNQTGEAIRIDEIKADCGCIVSEDSPSRIPANGSVGIKVRFNVSPVPGEFSHMVQVKLASSDPASLFLKIRGNVVPIAALHASPPSLDFGRMTESETRTRTICVSRHDFSSVEESKLTSNLKGCTLEARRAAHSQTVLVSVTLRGGELESRLPLRLRYRGDEPSNLPVAEDPRQGRGQHDWSSDELRQRLVWQLRWPNVQPHSASY